MGGKKLEHPNRSRKLRQLTKREDFTTISKNDVAVKEFREEKSLRANGNGPAQVLTGVKNDVLAVVRDDLWVGVPYLLVAHKHAQRVG